MISTSQEGLCSLEIAKFLQIKVEMEIKLFLILHMMISISYRNFASLALKLILKYKTHILIQRIKIQENNKAAETCCRHQITIVLQEGLFPLITFFIQLYAAVIYGGIRHS
jgi:hypothetical protein